MLHKSLFILGAFAIILLIAILSAAIYIYKNYTVVNTYVDGNTHYTDQEIMDMVMDGRFGHNSIYLSFKYRDKAITGIPFVEKMDVEVVSPDTIKINVYEKAVAGYVKYLDRYIYFDRDGIVVETSSEPSEGVPLVLGLDFDYVVLHEKLPVADDNIFAEILDVTQVLTKYNLDADKIFFDSEFHIYIYFGSVEVSLGTNENIDEKIIQLQYILPKLEGKSGILEMSDYDANTQNITFEEKK
ncbi:cell division protein FtsQ/DivIB [Butyrivibrio sp. MB2005]|uniref:cell division protein FtsQ/DivIB n=1 Tax=Butyrivibrio sp. MB2005 TaxID=1280678 RepID=UPI001FA74239|nr:FtsQ-type POTRA domain-containing protein [Butyrivibrio sp. MB2005]